LFFKFEKDFEEGKEAV